MPRVVLAPTQSPAAAGGSAWLTTPVLSVDFSGYADTTALLVDDNDPFNFTSMGAGGDIVLGTSNGFNGRAKFMEYQYPDNGGGGGNYTIRRQIIASKSPYNTYLDWWLEVWLRFSDGTTYGTGQWDTDGGVGCAFPDHKTWEVFVEGAGTYERFQIKVGAGGSGIQQSSPEYNAGNNEATCNNLSGMVAEDWWTGEWCGFRMSATNMGTGAADGTWSIDANVGNSESDIETGVGWVNIHSETLRYGDSGGGASLITGIKDMQVGQNRNCGMQNTQEIGWGGFHVFDAAPW